MSLTHLKAGSELPELKKGTLRLYSMVFCPYAHRTRLVLAAKKIPFEVVNINTKNKPEWYSKINPDGTVPCLQHDDGRTVSESLVVSEYLDNIYPEHRLAPTDPYLIAQHKILIERFASKVASNLFKIFRNLEDENLVKDLSLGLDYFENVLQKDFFGGDQPALVDYMIWPFFERIEYLKVLRNFEIESSRHPKLVSYIQRMKEVPAVKELLISLEKYGEFFKDYLANKEPNYDVGLSVAA